MRHRKKKIEKEPAPPWPSIIWWPTVVLHLKLMIPLDGFSASIQTDLNMYVFFYVWYQINSPSFHFCDFISQLILNGAHHFRALPNFVVIENTMFSILFLVWRHVLFQQIAFLTRVCFSLAFSVQTMFVSTYVRTSFKYRKTVWHWMELYLESVWANERITDKENKKK